jgi:hypothetical protein
MSLDYALKPVMRPKWFTPLLVAWVLTGLPAALVGTYFRIAGVSPTEAPPPLTGFGDFLVELLVDAVVLLYVLGSPVALALAERNYRRRLRASEGMDASAHD